MEINITWNICRVCLLEEQKSRSTISGGEQMRHIFNDDKQLAKQIFECSGVTMKPNDSLPEKICKKCLMMVKHAVNFRKTCRASDTYLQSILQRTKSASSLFKPERQSSLDFLDETITNELIDHENENEEKEEEEECHEENDDLKTEEKVENVGTRKRKETLLEKSFKKPSKGENSSTEIDRNDDDLIAQDDDVEEISENDLNNMVEMEEIVEHPEENEAEMCHSNRKETSELQNFEINNEYRNISHVEADDSDEAEGTDVHNFKHESEELYYLLKELKDGNPSQIKENQQHLDSEMNENVNEQTDNVQFVPVEEGEGQLLHLESETDDSQAQVSSTVKTKEDYIDFEEQSSNTSNESNDLPTEYIVDEYLLDDSNSNITARNSNVVVINTKLQSSTAHSDKKCNSVILPHRKSQAGHTSATATSSTMATGSGSASQIWVCDICGNHFNNRQLMNAHMKVHRQEKNHECELCFKRFITACNLQAHMRTHTGEKPFECQYCGRKFSDRSSNLRHERIHTNEKPYQCNDCGKSFSLATTLKKHLKIHTGERSYRCEPCGKSFKLSHQLKAHFNTSLHKAVVQLGQADNC